MMMMKFFPIFLSLVGVLLLVGTNSTSELLSHENQSLTFEQQLLLASITQKIDDMRVKLTEEENESLTEAFDVSAVGPDRTRRTRRTTTKVLRSWLTWIGQNLNIKKPETPMQKIKNLEKKIDEFLAAGTIPETDATSVKRDIQSLVDTFNAKNIQLNPETLSNSREKATRLTTELVSKGKLTPADAEKIREGLSLVIPSTSIADQTRASKEEVISLSKATTVTLSDEEHKERQSLLTSITQKISDIRAQLTEEDDDSLREAFNAFAMGGGVPVKQREDAARIFNLLQLFVASAEITEKEATSVERDMEAYDRAYIAPFMTPI